MDRHRVDITTDVDKDQVSITMSSAAARELIEEFESRDPGLYVSLIVALEKMEVYSEDEAAYARWVLETS